MMTDALLQLSSAQAVTSTAVSTNTIDLSTANPSGGSRDVGGYNDLFVTFTIDQSFATATSVEFQIVTSANADLSSANVLESSGAIVIAQLTAGRKPICMAIPESILSSLPIGQRYLGANYVVAGSAATAGKISATITETPVSVGKNYPSGFTVA